MDRSGTGRVSVVVFVNTLPRWPERETTRYRDHPGRPRQSLQWVWPGLVRHCHRPTATTWREVWASGCQKAPPSRSSCGLPVRLTTHFKRPKCPYNLLPGLLSLVSCLPISNPRRAQRKSKMLSSLSNRQEETNRRKKRCSPLFADYLAMRLNG